jgi:hypothetical protein
MASTYVEVAPAAMIDAMTAEGFAVLRRVQLTS